MEARMRRVLVVSALLALAVTETGLACGDKFLVVGRGARFQRAYSSLHPGNILVYARASTPSTAAIRDTGLHKNLQKAGHRVALVEKDGLVTESLASGQVDIILVDASESPQFDARAAAAPSKPTVLYVLYDEDKKQAELISKQLQCKLKSSDKVNKYLSVIEDAMKARAAASGRAKRG
jgi:hypothetical protein